MSVHDENLLRGKFSGPGFEVCHDCCNLIGNQETTQDIWYLKRIWGSCPGALPYLKLKSKTQTQKEKVLTDYYVKVHVFKK